jgi:hypothetical protein
MSVVSRARTDSELTDKPIHRGKDASAVWNHGDANMLLSKPNSPLHQVCGYCHAALKSQVNGSTSNIRRHLKHTYKTTPSKIDIAESGEGEDEDNR